VIAKGDEPVVRLVPIRRGRFKLGIVPRDALGEVPDFLAPMDEEELRTWEGRS
jgi:antitoxin (DNA-binding transcriptional repressor) of toxin-antitoxin stability system